MPPQRHPEAWAIWESARPNDGHREIWVSLTEDRWSIRLQLCWDDLYHQKHIPSTCQFLMPGLTGMCNCLSEAQVHVIAAELHMNCKIDLYHLSVTTQNISRLSLLVTVWRFVFVCRWSLLKTSWTNLSWLHHLHSLLTSSCTFTFLVAPFCLFQLTHFADWNIFITTKSFLVMNNTTNNISWQLAVWI